MTHFDENMSVVWPEYCKQGIKLPWFSWTFYHKKSQGFKVEYPPPLGAGHSLRTEDKPWTYHVICFALKLVWRLGLHAVQGGRKW